MHRALVDDAHAIVEHSAEPSRPDGVKSPNAKFNPTTDKLLLTCEAAVLIRESRALMTGAAPHKGAFPPACLQRQHRHSDNSNLQNQKTAAAFQLIFADVLPNVTML